MAADEPRSANDPSVIEAQRPVAATRPAVTPGAPRARPDPRPMRLALGAGTHPAGAIMAAGLVRYPVSVADGAGDATTADAPVVETIATARPEVRIKHRTVYVHLKRGQKAPKGAKVIEGKAPPPRVVVTRIAGKPAATRQTRVRRAVVTRTRQSGR
jgi:hypothetical protein